MENLKNLVVTMAALVFLWSCNTGGMSNSKNIALIEKYVNAVENLDYETMASCLDDNYIGLGPSYGDSISKSQAVINWKESVDMLYESIKYNRSRNISVSVNSGDNKGDWVSNWAELNIKYKEGKGEVTLWANSIYKIENEKITKSYTFYNEADAMEQLGYVFINLNDLY
jgi:hypothetical protein